MSLRVRIILSYLLIIGVGFFYLVKKITDAKEIKPRYMESVEEPLVDSAHVLASLVESDMQEGSLELHQFRDAFRRAATRRFVAQIYSKTKTTLDLQVYITDDRGIVVFDSNGGQAEGQDYSRRNDVYLTLQGKYGARSTRADPDDPASSVLHVAAPIMSNDRIAGVLTVMKPQRSMASFMEKTRSRIILLGGIAASVVVVVGSVFATWLTRPIQRLTDYAKAVRDGRRVALPKLGASEVATLGRTIEDMRDALEGKKYIENYVQSLTHELRSPVAAIRGAAELMREEMAPADRERFLRNIQAETVRVEEIVDRMLLLSAVEAKKTLDQREPVDFAELLRIATTSIAPQAAGKKVELRTNIPPDRCVVEADAFLLEKALLNLLQNAVAFAPSGGWIQATLCASGNNCTATVDDNGPGIPEYAQPRVFERFYSLPRPDTGKKSSGLGLAFVREVAALHGGAASLTNRDGGGATATLILPSVPIKGGAPPLSAN